MSMESFFPCRGFCQESSDILAQWPAGSLLRESSPPVLPARLGLAFLRTVRETYVLIRPEVFVQVAGASGLAAWVVGGVVHVGIEVRFSDFLAEFDAQLLQHMLPNVRKLVGLFPVISVACAENVTQ